MIPNNIGLSQSDHYVVALLLSEFCYLQQPVTQTGLSGLFHRDNIPNLIFLM